VQPASLRRAGNLALLGVVLALVSGACRTRAPAPAAPRLSVLVPAAERRMWSAIGASFQEQSGVPVELIEGPNATDVRENLYTAALLARDDSFDLVYLDVTWTPKFAAAGWLIALDEAFAPADQAAFLPAALEAGRFQGRLYRVPMRTDVGLLYYRKDLLEAGGFAPPRTFGELDRIARALQSPPDLWGFVWQGSQYEGLVCNYLEVLRGQGGSWVDPDTLRVGLEDGPARAALETMRGTLTGDPISPPGITAYKEDESRRLFQDGRAVFLRNWSYVWRLVQARDSALAGKVGVQPMVPAGTAPASGTLGGWGLGVSRFSRFPREATAFIRHAASLDSQRALCIDSGYAPALRAAYDDPALRAANPFLADFLRLHESAVARPALPRYARVSDVLQRRLSAALSGLQPPEQALRAAARETRVVLGAAR
jgi:multiple sugar transport system substrate-binding protein